MAIDKRDLRTSYLSSVLNWLLDKIEDLVQQYSDYPDQCFSCGRSLRNKKFTCPSCHGPATRLGYLFQFTGTALLVLTLVIVPFAIGGIRNADLTETQIRPCGGDGGTCLEVAVSNQSVLATVTAKEMILSVNASDRTGEIDEDIRLPVSLSEVKLAAGEYQVRVFPLDEVKATLAACKKAGDCLGRKSFWVPRFWRAEETLTCGIATGYRGLLRARETELALEAKACEAVLGALIEPQGDGQGEGPQSDAQAAPQR